MTHSEQAAVWGRHAKQWAHVGVPLKPSDDDGRLTLAGLHSTFQRHPDRCLIAILGVTPELVQLPWPGFVELRAYDHSAQMIASVWSPNALVPSSATLARWQRLPEDDAIFHGVAGDGSLNVLPSFADYHEVLRELHRVMAPGAVAVIRCFIRPDVAETPRDVVAAVFAGQVGSFHVLKWRLAMSLAHVPGAAVAVCDIHEAFEKSFPSRSTLAAATGWPEAAIGTIDAYRGVSTRYTFPTLDELCEHCAPYFDVEEVRYATYELADRCPTVTLKRR